MTNEVGEIVFIGLDLARVAGMAVLSEDMKKCFVYEIKGTPHQQLFKIQDYVGQQPAIWGIEELHIFRNAKTVRSLSERIGFIKWFVKGMFNEKVLMISASKARRIAGAKNKKEALAKVKAKVQGPGELTDNHSDAVLIALAVAHETLGLDKQHNLSIPTVQIGDKE